MKHITKLLSLALALIMLVSVFTTLPLTAGAVTTDTNSTSATSGDYSYWLLDDGTAEIWLCTSEDKEITIPRELDGYLVTSIDGEYGFSYCSNLEKITIPDSITDIDSNAFYGCGKLKSINVDNLNKKYTSIDGILYNKDSTELIKYPIAKTDISFTIPKTVKSIGQQAFQDCINLESITISNNVEIIGDYAFSYCSNLSKVTIPDSVTVICSRAFADCSSLENITIGKGVNEIGERAFQDCGLKNITVNENNTYFSSEEGVLYNKDKTKLIQYPIKNTKTSFAIPDSVSKIGQGAFFRCDTIEYVLIPDSVLSIGQGSFQFCTNLKKVVMSNNVLFIGTVAFFYCDNLDSLTIPDSVISIGDYLFEEYGASTLNTTIYGYNGSVAEKYAEENEIKFASIGESSRTELSKEYTDYQYNLLYNDTLEIISYSGNDTEIDIPNKVDEFTVTKIGNSSFINNFNITKVIIPDSVLSIELEAFYNCKKLKNIIIPYSVTSIEDNSLGYYGNTYEKIDDFTITGYSNSEAENYANKNGFKFISMGEAPTTEPTTSTEPAESSTSTTPTESNSTTELSESSTATTPSESFSYHRAKRRHNSERERNN